VLATVGSPLIVNFPGLEEANWVLAQDLLEHVELGGFKGFYPAQLSGGMRQRVAVDRALAIEPDFLLLDEPFAGLDLALRMQIVEFLRRLLDEEARTAVYVTHDVREALALGDRMVLLSARPAQVQHMFNLRGQAKNGWRLEPRLRQIEEEAILALLAD
jgi:NitT/TauT family transport system ATP-binding protein